MFQQIGKVEISVAGPAVERPEFVVLCTYNGVPMFSLARDAAEAGELLNRLRCYTQAKKSRFFPLTKWCARYLADMQRFSKPLLKELAATMGMPPVKLWCVAGVMRRYECSN